MMMLRNLLIVVTFMLFAVTLPHALEDFQYGDLARFGVGVPLGIVLLVTVYGLQFLGVVLLKRGNSNGALLLAAMGAIWCSGVLIVHGHDMLFAGADYRHGMISKLLELCIVGLGAFSAWLGVRLGWGVLHNRDRG